METSSEDFPASLSRRARKAAENARLASADAQPPKNNTKIPQTSSRHAPSSSYLWKQNLAKGSRPAASSTSSVSDTTSRSAMSYSTVNSTASQDTSKQARNVLRRKLNTLNREPANSKCHNRNISTRSESSSSVPRSQVSIDSSLDRGLTDSPAEIRVAQKVEIPSANAQEVTIYPELDRYRDFKPQTNTAHQYFDVPYPISTDLPPPTPLFSAASSQHSAFSGSPSTRHSESPSNGPYSRDTTPTSMSSQSPGIAAPLRYPLSKAKQSSPSTVRSPATRLRAGSSSNDREWMPDYPSFPAARESSTSTSSNSTVRAPAATETQHKTRLGTAAPTPPIRKSSEQYSRSRDLEQAVSTGTREHAKAAPTQSSSAHRFDGDATRARNVPTPRTAPSRPSREGTTDLHSQIGLPVPIVHSNLSTVSLSEKQGSSQNLPGVVSRTTTPSRSEQSLPASRPRIGREPTPNLSNSNAASNTSRTALRTPSPSVSSSLKSRFPLFGRRTKTAPEVPTAATEKKERAPRKGPAAGTGHEGYGRLGHVRRRSGTLTNALRAIPGTMSSQESLASNQPSDPFLAQRMSPVIIAGGTVIENRNNSVEITRTESQQSIPLPRPGIAGSRNASQASLSSQEARNTLWPSALPRGSQNMSSIGHRRLPSDSSDSDVLSMKPTLAYRRSIQRLKGTAEASLRLPKPLVVRAGSTTPAITSHDTTLLSDDSTFSSRPSTTNARNESPVPKKLTKKPKSPRKWNIFSRSSSQPADKKKQPSSSQRKVSAPVNNVQQKPVAFYTMMDSSEREDNDIPDVQDVLREARSSQLPSPMRAPSSNGRPSLSRNQSQQSIASSSTTREPERLQSRKMTASTPCHSRQDSSSEVTQQKTPLGSKPPSAWRNRPNRLPQVGRIPQVASRSTPDPPIPSPVSFTRTLNGSSLQIPSSNNSSSSLNVSVVEDSTPPEPPSPAISLLRRVSRSFRRTEEPVTSPSADSEDLPARSSPRRSHSEFLRFSPRKNSEGTSTTESSSVSGILSYSDATAVIPGPNAPLAEDEVWDEYNDLLGDNDVPRGHPSTTSSLGRPFHLEVWGRSLAAESDQPMVSPTINSSRMPAQMDELIDSVESECETEFEAEPMEDPVDEPVVEIAPMASSVYSSGLTAKINEVLDAAGAPRSPFSVNDFTSGYGSQTNSLEMTGTPSQRVSTSSAQLERVVRNSQASTSSQGSDDNSTVSQVNLRVGSMQVSKWLTFGHVLFSPVRDALLPMVGSLHRHSILVIDGLGNDDWSFYAAETYPAATFFNLSPRMPLSTGQQGSHNSSPLSPPNHHQIHYKSHTDKFPFGTQSFTCVVYRFPAAAPESHYRNIINEARRVLKPGGYIELSILDVDMNNMGNRARRAVRRLKERVHIRSPDISLASSSDLLLRLLGRKGFTDIKTCRVGVPLASTIAESSAVGQESSSSSFSKAGGASASTRPSAVRRVKRETRSLAEMMKAEGPGADESITKMVAKVGRWWYDRCYQSVALESGGKSMWGDRSLLAECEEWRTSLKLMVCHARIPDGRSRVASI